ncbi:MAG TPA: phosphate propanoyltransferase [Bacillota bacterium]|nr:phosphate propanoyltransferase [Bacillota bacterium]HPF42436.1 phosphate propanoyltransferase [Bacillota bacterium]HPJ85694.1 phosphate propanoyltransferase [Bacillota bacterium]HPQ61669.1 phosphate propanoyltransferase [Bacillota bacterium]HRX91985.1 phosphate propanoyltransferase [Candidatus Izemoplasmatales bacterium]
MDKKILVEVSARHVHINEKDLETLFGSGYKLTAKKMLSQPGQFACEEKVTVIGPKKEMNLTILGPTRSKTQVEISLTDARTLGITAPVRESGDIAGTAPCRIVGPKGFIDIKEGVIVAKRHVHLTPEVASLYQVADKDIVSVRVDTPERSLVFGDVVIRVRADFSPAMHIDTDEGNAAGISGEVFGIIL